MRLRWDMWRQKMDSLWTNFRNFCFALNCQLVSSVLHNEKNLASVVTKQYLADSPVSYHLTIKNKKLNKSRNLIEDLVWLLSILRSSMAA